MCLIEISIEFARKLDLTAVDRLNLIQIGSCLEIYSTKSLNNLVAYWICRFSRSLILLGQRISVPSFS